MLYVFKGLNYTSATIKFIETFNRAFDCLNVSRASVTDKNYDKLPYKSLNDPRFEV